MLCTLLGNPVPDLIRRNHDEKPITQAEDTLVGGDRLVIGDPAALLAELYQPEVPVAARQSGTGATIGQPAASRPPASVTGSLPVAT